VLVKRAGAALGIPVIPARMAILTKPLNGRVACHYCGQCGRGCVTASNYSSSQVQILPALKRNLRSSRRDGSGGHRRHDASAGHFLRGQARTESNCCRSVVVAAGACETARLLLNSKATRHSDGLANSSGTVGRYLMIRSATDCPASFRRWRVCRNTTTATPAGVYMPWWELEKKGKEFPRGYHVEVGGGFGLPESVAFRALPGCGKATVPG
jgi:choline dehydrogenase-like flavoprotein